MCAQQAIISLKLGSRRDAKGIVTEAYFERDDGTVVISPGAVERTAGTTNAKRLIDSKRHQYRAQSVA